MLSNIVERLSDIYDSSGSLYSFLENVHRDTGVGVYAVISGNIVSPSRYDSPVKGIGIPEYVRQSKSRVKSGGKIWCPLFKEGEVIGVAEIPERYSEEDIEVICGILSLLVKMAIMEDKERVIMDKIIHVLVSAIDTRDYSTGSHSSRVATLSVMIANNMGIETADKVKLAALIHDIGKLGIPDYILRKPGKVTDKEYELIKKHPVYTYEIAKSLESCGFGDIPIIAKCHHERYDGKGYPSGLKGDQIPLEARIIAVADVFDALTSDRYYRKGMSVEKALSIISKESGKAFDPEVVDAFMSLSLRDVVSVIERESDGNDVTLREYLHSD